VFLRDIEKLARAWRPERVQNKTRLADVVSVDVLSLIAHAKEQEPMTLEGTTEGSDLIRTRSEGIPEGGGLPGRKCALCGAPFSPKRSHQKFCSNRCRRGNHKQFRQGGPGQLPPSEPTRSLDDLFAFRGRPLFVLKTCPDCGGGRFAWVVGCDAFACVRCEPPTSGETIAAYLIAPGQT